MKITIENALLSVNDGITLKELLDDYFKEDLKLHFEGNKVIFDGGN